MCGRFIYMCSWGCLTNESQVLSKRSRFDTGYVFPIYLVGAQDGLVSRPKAMEGLAIHPKTFYHICFRSPRLACKTKMIGECIMANEMKPPPTQCQGASVCVELMITHTVVTSSLTKLGHVTATVAAAVCNLSGVFSYRRLSLYQRGRSYS